MFKSIVLNKKLKLLNWSKKEIGTGMKLSNLTNYAKNKKKRFLNYNLN